MLAPTHRRDAAVIAAGIGILAVCSLPSLRALGGGLHRGIVWGRFAERRAILVAFLPYALALLALRKRTVSPRLVLGFGLAFYAVLAVLPAVASRDMYSYLAYGRMTNAGLNPMSTSPSHLGAGPWLPLVGWRGTPSVYGPLWTYISAAAASIGHVYPAALVLKLLSVSGALTACVLAPRMASEAPGRRTWLLCALLWNPLVIFSTAGDGHVDGLIAGMVLVAAVARRRERPLLATLLLVTATMLKLYCGVFLALHIGLLLVERRSRIRAVAGHTGLALGVLAASYVPFWQGAATFAGLERVGGSFAAGFPAMMRTGIQNLMLHWGFGAARADALSAHVVEAIAALALVLALGVIVLRVDTETTRAWGLGFAAYLLVATWFVPWHAIPLLVLAAAHEPQAKDRVDLLAGALALSVTGTIAVSIVRFGIPLVVAALVARRRGAVHPLPVMHLIAPDPSHG